MRNHTHCYSMAVLMVLFAIGGGVHAQTQQPDLDPSALLPANLTNEGEPLPEPFPINTINLPASLQKEGSSTTDVSAITDPAHVEDLTFDDSEHGRIVFKESVDLSQESAVNLLRTIDDNIEFDDLSITVGSTIYDTLDSAVEFTFYNVPFVWDPAVQLNGITTSPEDITNFTLKVENGRDVVSFIARKSGTYTLAPKLSLLFENEQVVKGSRFVILGRVSDPKADIRLTLNTNEIPSSDVELDPATGEFSATVDLVRGSNLISVEGESDYGSLDAQTKLIFFEERATPVREESGLSPMVFLAVALVVITLLFVLANRLSKRR